MLSSSCLNPFPLSGKERRERFSEIIFLGHGHYVLLPQFPLRVARMAAEPESAQMWQWALPWNLSLPFPTSLPELAFSLEGVLTRLMSGFVSSWKQSGLSSARVLASKQNKSHW